MNIFKQRIQELRTGHNLTYAEFGKLVGADRSTIWRYEKGEREPNVNFLILLAKKFNVSIDWLAGLTNIKDPDVTSQTLIHIFNALSDNKKIDLVRYAKFLKAEVDDGNYNKA